jgi:hypothetical protein
MVSWKYFVWRKFWLNLREYPRILLAELRKTMKCFSQNGLYADLLNVIQSSSRNWLILFFQMDEIWKKKKPAAWKPCTLNICAIQCTSVPGSWTSKRYQMHFRYSVSLANPVIYIEVVHYIMYIHSKAVTRISRPASQFVIPPDWKQTWSSSKKCIFATIYLLVLDIY